MRLSPSVAILRTQSDERLVELARGDSEAAFAAIVERYRRPMLRSCRRVLPESRAEDATQQAFIAAWRALERGDAVVDLRAWLMRIARNTALNALRVQGYDYDELRDSLRGSEAPQSELERRDVVRQTLAGLAALPERQRDALIRSAVEGASHAEIAAALGLSEGAARQLVLRARATMRSAATALTPGPLLAWLAGRGAADAETVHRIAELATGAGAGGAAALLAKASVVTVVAGGVVVGPSVVRHDPERAKADPPPAASAKPRTPTAAAASVVQPAGAVKRTSSKSGADDGSSGSSLTSGHGGSGDDAESSNVPEHDNSGPGGSDDTEPDAPDGNSGPGGGGDGAQAVGPEIDSSGPGGGSLDSSGGGSSGSSGSSGSGSGSGGDQPVVDKADEPALELDK